MSQEVRCFECEWILGYVLTGFTIPVMYCEECYKNPPGEYDAEDAQTESTKLRTLWTQRR